jgi:hypothetical protein
MFQLLAAQGVISKAELPDYLSSIPQDPAALPDYLNTYKTAGMKPEEQMKFTTPTADAKLQSDTSVKTTGMNNATQIAVQKAISDRQDSKGDTEPTLDQDTLTSMAQQYLAGDKSVMQNLGRGAQGSANIVALRKEITAQAKAKGMTGPQIAAAMADYVGTLAGQRTAGTRIANVEMASDEAQRLIPLAKQASAEVARSGFLPFGKAQNMFDDQTNDPALRKFAAANNALVNVYSRAISPGGVATVSDKEHARHMLSTAMDHKSYLAVLDQMQREIQAAREAPQAVRGAFRDRVTGGAPAAPAARPPYPPAGRWRSTDAGLHLHLARGQALHRQRSGRRDQGAGIRGAAAAAWRRHCTASRAERCPADRSPAATTYRRLPRHRQSLPTHRWSTASSAAARRRCRSRLAHGWHGRHDRRHPEAGLASRSATAHSAPPQGADQVEQATPARV